MKKVKFFKFIGKDIIGELENGINTWLKESSGIKILDILQNIQVQEDSFIAIVSIWYEDKQEKEADDPKEFYIE